MDVRRLLTVAPGVPRLSPPDIGLRLVVIAGLVINAAAHFHLAHFYDGTKESISQGALFRIEGALAIGAAVLVLLARGRIVALVAFAVLSGGAFAVLLYRYVNVGEFGPLPNMYEPFWYDDKTLSVWAESIGAAAALALVVITHRASSTPALRRDL
ncbi:hypothetical protein [Sporichthya sp.]|uniref:hypothetical protein n=1 Tax=Sporichthya sp. TaxID=65475 RepID=UPI00182B7E6B|nr:hypothetical protein [Sporichthya sp.]MBA3742602.1 hypothetical protein [Sporichthya sp.]